MSLVRYNPKGGGLGRLNTVGDAIRYATSVLRPGTKAKPYTVQEQQQAKERLLALQSNVVQKEMEKEEYKQLTKLATATIQAEVAKQEGVQTVLKETAPLVTAVGQTHAAASELNAHIADTKAKIKAKNWALK